MAAMPTLEFECTVAAPLEEVWAFYQDPRGALPVLTPWLAGRASRLNSVVVFGGLLFWGWFWGGWGLVLGLPIMMVFKAVCDNVEDLKPIGEFMAE